MEIGTLVRHKPGGALMTVTRKTEAGYRMRVARRGRREAREDGLSGAAGGGDATEEQLTPTAICRLGPDGDISMPSRR